jgi:hypothetical protein
MLVILSRDPHRMQGSSIERACVLCRTAYNGDPHAVQTSAVQNSAEPANAEGIPCPTRQPSAASGELLLSGRACPFAAWPTFQ